MDIDQGLLLKIKNSLRIKHTALDDDVTDSIAACLADLHVCGVQEPAVGDPQELDPLILNAVKLYCKAEYTDDTEKAAAYLERYNGLKACLMMAEGYREEAVKDE
jgi:hypothetical protein